MENIYRFSYDDREDALRSLANYYSIDLSILEAKLKDIYGYIKELKNIDCYDELSLNGMMQNEIRTILNPTLVEKDNAKIRVSFYHRCSTDGTKEWFKEGLLNNVDGIECFIRKVEDLVPQIKSMNLNVGSIVAKSKHKAFNEERRELDGICGFYRYQEARSEISSSYVIPEIFDDFGLYLSIKEKLKFILTNTIVKFYVDREVNYLNVILEKYWDILWTTDDADDIYNSSSNVGMGKTIPYENIEKIYVLG